MTDTQPTLEALTPRDREVLSLIMIGLNNCEIAKKLEVGHQTVRNRVSKMYKKLALPPRRTSLILWAVQHNCADPAKIAPWRQNDETEAPTNQ